MTAPFARLAARVETAWARTRYQPDALALIAAEALRTLEPEVPTNFAELADWLFDDAALPPQRSLDQAFGQPPVTVYANERFFIELLFWHTGTTGIHQHAFSGAFRVLCGASLHSIYDFVSTDVIDDRLELGDLTLRATEVLEVGAVRPIHSGRGLIHAAFHLDNPSVTLVVRSHSDGAAELEYKPPGLAMDPSARDARTVKLLQLMGLLAQRPGSDYARRVANAVAAGDAYAGVQLLLRARYQTDPTTFGDLLDGFARRHPRVAARLRDVADEEVRRFTVRNARERITDADHRFFLALLMNLPDRRSILDAIAQRHPTAEPLALLIGWLRACARRDRLGFELDATLTEIVRGRLAGGSHEAVTRQLTTAAPGARITVVEVARACDALERIPVLAPLFRC